MLNSENWTRLGPAKGVLRSPIDGRARVYFFTYNRSTRAKLIASGSILFDRIAGIDPGPAAWQASIHLLGQ